MSQARPARVAPVRSQGRTALVPVLAAAGLLGHTAPSVAEAWSMSCQRDGKTYQVAYDTASRSFRTDNAQLGTRFRINRAQVDKNAALVWVTAVNFSVPRDVLVQFGEDKWVKYFFGNGSQITDRCR